MSPISAGNTRRKSSRPKSRSTFRWASSDEVGAVGVEEPDHAALRILLHQPDGEAAGVLRAPRDEACDRHRGHLEVEDVGPRGVGAGHHRPLQHAGRPARVAGRDDGGVLLQRGGVGHRHAGGQLGGDVDVGQPGHPDRPNSEREPRLSHTIERLMTAPCSTVLNGYTFTPLASTACSPTKHSSPSTTPSSPRTPPRRSQERPIVAPRRRTPSPR